MLGRTAWLLSLVAAVVSATGTLADASALEQPTYAPRAEPARFARVLSSLEVDGRLDESSWSLAAPVTRFFEIYPANVGEPRAATDARFLYDEDNVYIGIRAHDPRPSEIRAPLAKRDQMQADQDYAEILLDTANARRSALVFRTNARGIPSDAQFSEDTQTRTVAPDFDFDVGTSVDDGGWSAEFRIPLSTLRYESGNDQVWRFVIFRGYPRGEFVRMASAPIPRGANCQLCFAAPIEGISLAEAPVPVSIMPQTAYYRTDTENAGVTSSAERIRAGVDVRWQPRPDSTLDLTFKPDFSQVEADAVQLTANARFALFVAEKRPFFLEGIDLFGTPISALYTRSITDPDLGARLTHRGDILDFTALAVRDAGGGSIIEPGPMSSQIGPQDFESNAVAGRYQFGSENATFGTLGSARLNDDGSQNMVLGVDAVWSPSASNRFVAQALWSETENPDRPDLLEVWTGQKVSGGATALRWEHRMERWFADVTHERLSHHFRSWNGFVPQVGVTSTSAGGGLNFYPDGSFLLRLTPSLQLTRIDEIGADQVDGSTALGLQVEAGLGASFTMTLLRDLEPSLTGLQTLDSVSMRLSLNPAPWVPSISVGAGRGDGLDVASGHLASSTDLSAAIRLRLFERLDFDASMARQDLDSRSGSGPRQLLTDTAAQLKTTWHFSHMLYAQVLYQQSWTSRPAPADVGFVEERFRSEFSSLLLSYQSNWRTRFFLGLSRSGSRVDGSPLHGTRQTEAFAKFTYALSMSELRPLFRQQATLADWRATSPGRL